LISTAVLPLRADAPPVYLAAARFFEREVFISVQVVDPKVVCPRFLGGAFAVEEKDIGLDALGGDLNSLGAKNETGGPRGRRAGKRGVNIPSVDAARCERRLA